MGRRQALWDLETTITTFNNNFILRAHLEQSDGKTIGSGFVVLATKITKGAKGAKREERVRDGNYIQSGELIGDGGTAVQRCGSQAGDTGILSRNAQSSFFHTLRSKHADSVGDISRYSSAQ